MKLQSLPTFLVRRKNWLLMAALALSLTAALLLRPSIPAGAACDAAYDIR